MSAYQTSTGVADPVWAERVVSVLRGCPLMDVFRAAHSLPQPTQWSLTRLDGSEFESRSGFWDEAQRAADDGQLHQILVDANDKRRSWLHCNVGYVVPFNLTDRVWFDGFSIAKFSATSEEFGVEVGMDVLDAATPWLAQAAAAIDAPYGFVDVRPFRRLIPDNRAIWAPAVPPPGVDELDELAGFGMVFVVGPRAFEALGGMTWLAGAPVYQVEPVEYRSGATGAVVRVARDSADFVERLDETFGFFEPFLADQAAL